MKSSILKEQGIPLVLTAVTAGVLIFILWLEIYILNIFTPSDILLNLRVSDILVGMTIYLKTSIDFAIFMAHLMDQNPGWKSRIAIEIGTAVGNALGTFIVLIVWAFFKEVHWLLALMIFIAALVLFKLAEQSLEHVIEEHEHELSFMEKAALFLKKVLARFNQALSPLLKYVVPNLSMKSKTVKTFFGLLAFSFTIPFILGLDDFAGYVPLFSVINVFGFGTGVILGHMILNILLYISPAKTVKIVKNDIISFIGSLVFISLGIWGLIEVFKLLFLH